MSRRKTRKNSTHAELAETAREHLRWLKDKKRAATDEMKRLQQELRATEKHARTLRHELEQLASDLQQIQDEADIYNRIVGGAEQAHRTRYLTGEP